MSTSFTIALLPVSLSLIHVPSSRIPSLYHPILRQILQPNPTFLNITCNDIELSLFAESHLLDDFETLARRDRQRQRSRSGSGSSTRNYSVPNFNEPIEITYEKWSVLQIDSHSDQLDNSGARVHELSAPLASAGISILYQSSYMSDFIFVKESRLLEVMSILGSSGFDLYSSDSNQFASRMVSPVLSHTSTDDASSISDLSPESLHESGAIFTRTRSNTDVSLCSISSAMQPFQVDGTSDHGESSSLETISHPHHQTSRSKSHSPTSGEVIVLAPDLACVGLSDDNIDNWALKVIKLVAFPDLINNSCPAPAPISRASTAIATGFPDGPGLPLSPAAISFSSRGRHLSSSSSSSSSVDDEDGYFSHSPRGNSTSSLISSASRSYPDLAKIGSINISPSFKPVTKRLIAPLSPLEPPPSRPSSNHTDTASSLSWHAHSHSNTQTRAQQRNRVSFFSFTRTTEGSSLTTDLRYLAALFPPNERHLIQLGNELETCDAWTGEDTASGEGEDSTLKCLQIDLRRFGLDKHGLVNRFSRVLEENGINHMYSSTFKTANLLVDKRHAARAQALLRAC